jgi:GNAT superfamily N-acetyltransferase
VSADFLSLARRLERAQALQNERLNLASGGRSRPFAGGFAHARGAGHPLSQALGVVEPTTDAELAEVEAFLGRPTVLELSPAVDESVWRLLAQRGYRVRQFQQLWVRDLSDGPEEVASPLVSLATDGGRFNQVAGAGFQDRDDWEAVEPPFVMPIDVDGVQAFLVEVDGAPAGGGVLGMVEGVALLSGAVVLPRFRGRGLQQVLIRHRLHWAQVRGCDVACASTAPGSASQRSYERCGFRAAYPKLELCRD